tara:strand:- start:130 stop:693 length:564 start_codon:yes stop_codon:yes gene_type:complete
MSRQAWKNKLKEAKKFVKAAHELEDDMFSARYDEAIANNDRDAVDQIVQEQADAHKERNFKVDGKSKKKDITDPELLKKFKKANFNKRKGVYTWADGGRQAAREMRVSKKKNMASPVAMQGALATVSRNLDRWEMGYGTEISLKKGSVVMPISEPYEFHDKKCITVMSGPNVFKGVPVAVLRPVDDE